MITAYRGWKVRRVNGAMALLSPVSDCQWNLEETRALCNKCSTTERLFGAVFSKTDIAENCTCGLYALKTPVEVASRFIYGGVDIIGEVLLYGKILIGETGYRAEKAKVGTLLLPTVRPMQPEDVEELARNYGVGLMVLSDPLRKQFERARVAYLRRTGQLPVSWVQKSRWRGHPRGPYDSYVMGQ